MVESVKNALEITTKLVEAKLSNSDMVINAETGKAVASYYEAIFDKVVEIIEKK